VLSKKATVIWSRPGWPSAVADELRAEGRAADADHEEVLEFAARTSDRAAMDFRDEVVDRGERAGDLGRDFASRRQMWRAQPVMADHAVLVGVGDGAFFERGHVGETPFSSALRFPARKPSGNGMRLTSSDTPSAAL